MRFIDGLGNNLIVGGLGASSGGAQNSNLLMLPTEGAPALQFRSGNTSFAQIAGDPAGKLVMATGARSWRFESNGNLTPGTSDTDYSIGGASVPLMLRGSAMELRNGGNTAVKIESNGTVKLGASGVCTGTAVRLQDNYFEKEWEFNFPAGSEGRFCELHFTPIDGVGFAGLIEISVTGSWYGENASGSLVKRFQVGLRNGQGEQSNRHVAAASLTAKNFAISDFSWDATYGRWRVKIVHLRNTQNWVVIRVKGQSGSAYNTIDPLLGIAMNYPDGTEALPQEALVSYDTPVSFAGSAAAPTAGTRSAGTRAIVNASLCSAIVDYAVGYENDAMWFSVADTVKSFKWYGNTTPMMNLTGGLLKLGSLGPGNRSVLEFYKDGLVSAVTGCVGFDAAPGTNIFLRNNSASGNIVLSACSRAWAVSPTGEFFPAAPDGDYAVGRSATNYRVANYWGVNGNFSGNLTVGGTLGVTGAVNVGSVAGYSMVYETDTLRFSVPTAKLFKWYEEATPKMTLANGVLDVQSGVTVGGATTQGRYLRANASGVFVSSTLQPGDLSAPVPLDKGGTNSNLVGTAAYSLIYVGQSGGCCTVPPNTAADPAYLRSVGNGSAGTGLNFGPVIGVVPPAGIIAWVKNITAVPQSIPTGFVECNGGTTSVRDGNGNLETVSIPDLNGTGTDPRRFIRGAPCSNTSGGAHYGGCQSHGHTLSTSTSAVQFGACGNVIKTVSVDETTTLPPYFEAVWLMRVS